MEITIPIRLNGKQPRLSILSPQLSLVGDWAELYVFIRQQRHGSWCVFISAEPGVIEGISTECIHIKDGAHGDIQLAY